MERHQLMLYKILAVAALLSLWEVLPRLGIVDPLFIPSLSGVLSTIYEMTSSGELGKHTLVSLVRALSGLLAALVVGLPLGLLLGGWFPRVQTATEPLMELFAQANPVILAHIIIFFLGIGQTAKVFIIAWLCIWPITFSTIAGIRSVDPTLVKAARSLGLGRFRLFLIVVLPSAAGSIFTGLRLAAGYAYIMLVASEMMGASSGLGFLVVQSQESYNITRIFAGASVITLLAVVTDQLLKLVEKRLSFREENDADDYVRMRQAVLRPAA